MAAAGVVTLSSREARRRDADYLQRELAERLEREPIVFTMELELAGDTDPVNDPTAEWRGTRVTVTAGRLEVTGPDAGCESDGLVFRSHPPDRRDRGAGRLRAVLPTARVRGVAERRAAIPPR